MFERLFAKVTPSGITLDRCIQPSVDNTGKITGLVAGDEESYEVIPFHISISLIKFVSTTDSRLKAL
jgi:ATP:guanido phosphotransferase, N-terminal domain